MKINNKHIVIYLSLLILISSCVEPFTPGTESFENLLVINATLTNEYKFQEINLSKTYKLEEDANVTYEADAQIVVKDDSQNTYNFLELYPGKYRSVSKFKIEIGKKYQLFIATANGKKYTSTQEEIFSEKGLDNVYAEKKINDSGEEGISVFVDSYDATRKSKYYRYEYIETYKVVAPYATGFDAIEISYNPIVFEVIPSTEEKRVCYKTTLSTIIQQKNTLNLTEDKIDRFPVLFIKERDYKTTYRYSILVKQYIQTLNAYTFYKTLNKFSGSETVFSQVQTGAFNGNVFEENNKNNRVLGFFEVASVSSKRTYFKHHDFFPENTYPNYFTYCYETIPKLETPVVGLTDFAGSPLLDALASGDWVFYGLTGNPGAPLVLVPTECGDCTSFASNIKPDYWID